MLRDLRKVLGIALIVALVWETFPLLPARPGGAQGRPEELGPPGGPPTSPPKGPPERSRIPAQVPSEDARAVIDPPPLPEVANGRGQKNPFKDLPEAAGRRGAQSRAYRTPGGGVHAMELFSGPVHYEDDSGQWQPIDTRLVREGDGYTNAANSFSVRLPQTLDPESPITVTFEQGTIRLYIEVAGESRAQVDGSTLTYPDVLRDADLTYEITPTGFRKAVTFRSPDADGSIRYRVETDLALVEGENGELQVETRDDEVVAVIPPAFAEDADLDERKGEGDRNHDIERSFTQTEEGAYLLEDAIPAAWFHDEEREFPVVLDPETVVRVGKDTFVQSNIGNTSKGGSTELKAGSYESDGWPRAFSYLRFPLANVRDLGDVITDARLDVYAFHSWDGQSREVNLHRVKEWWSPSVTWPDRPGVESSRWASAKGCGANQGCNGWHYFDVTDLVQHWMDNFGNEGMRLWAPGPHPQSWRKFYSDDAGGNGRPALQIVANFFPDAPKIAAGAPGMAALPDPEIVTTDSPALKLAEKVKDPNGDDVFVRFQVSTDPNDFTAGARAYNSGWIQNTKTHVVPPGKLKDGETYYWRAQSWDGYAIMGRDRPTSLEKPTFTISTRKFGSDARWAMWSHGLGNEMEVSVNQANGNLVLDYPVESATTPAGDLELSLAYNSQSAADWGLSRGWDVAAGPASDPRDLPVRLRRLGGNSDDPHAVRVIYRDGNQRVYPHVAGKTYRGPGSAVVQRYGSDNGWKLTTAQGGMFVFDARGHIISARPASASAGTKSFSYSFDDNGRIQSVTDPIDRTVDFTWTAASDANGQLVDRLSRITFWDDRFWTLEYDVEGRLASVGDPNLDEVAFGYDDQGLLASVRDGESSRTLDDPPTTITYVAPNGAASNHVAVDSVTIAGSEEPYRFTYTYDGSRPTKIADTTRLTDPRGAATPDQEDPDDFTTITDLNRQGLPILTRGPRAEDGRWPEVRQFWDGHGNLLCRREPLANEIDPTLCVDEDTAGDDMNTKYVYEDKHPYRLIRVVEPLARAGTTRLRRNYGYDEGFTGLTTEFYKNPNLRGLPHAQRIWGRPRAMWGTGGPGVLDGTVNDFSIRWTGQIHADHSGSDAKTYRFRLFTEDNGRLQIGGRMLSDCWGAEGSYEANCGDGTAEHDLKPGLHNVVVEYQALSGNAEVDLKWKQPDGVWETIPSSSFRPNLGVLTSETERSEGIDHSVRTLTYEGPDPGASKLQGLPSEITLAGNNTEPVTESFEYDGYGRVTTETDATSKAITHEYSDGNNRSCETRTTDREDLVVEWECNPAGDVTDERVHVDADHVRHTHTEYDSVGRVERIDHPAGGSTHRDYDGAGRLVQETVEAAGEEVAGEEVASESRTSEYSYTPQGWLHQELLPPADETEAADPPSVRHFYDEVGNEERTLDARDNEWTRTFDAANRQITATDPTSETWVTEYDIAGNVEAETDPAGVRSEGTFDTLGRQTSATTLGTETTFQHDTRGNITRESDGDTYVERTFDGAGRVLTQTEPVGPGGEERTVTFTYDAAGRLAQTTGYQGRVSDHDYDDMGRLTGVTLPYDPQATPPPPHTYGYNAAGELTRVELPTQAGEAPIVYEYSHDRGGRLERETDGVGNDTTFHYNWAGETVRVEDPRGLTIRHRYDGRGRHVLRRAEDADGNVVQEDRFAYDKEDNQILAANDQGDIEADYDDAGRLVEVRAPSRITTYEFVDAQLRSRTDAAGRTAYEYRANGRLASATDPFTGSPTAFTYTAGGRLKTRTEPSGVTHAYDYDAAARVIGAVSTSGTSEVASYSYSYNANSRVTKKTQDVSGSGDNGTWTYRYDEAMRLTLAEDPDGAPTTYEYDGAGNRTAVDGPDGRVETGYNAAGRPTTASDGTTFSHDEAGNLTGIAGPEDTWTYSYDPFNRLVQAAEGAGATHTFAYDALDRQVTKTSDGATTSYGYAGLGEELIETSTPDATTHIAYASGAPLAQRAGGITSFFGIDPSHSDVTFLTGQDGSISGTKTYDAWGVPREKTGRSSHLGFQSDPTDPDTGFVDMGARLYAPELGRFTTSDPFRGDPERPMTMNRYLYAHGAPTTNIDPTGMAIPCQGAECKSVKNRSNVRRIPARRIVTTRSSASFIKTVHQHSVAVKTISKQTPRRAPKRVQPPKPLEAKMLRADPGRQVYIEPVRITADPGRSVTPRLRADGYASPGTRPDDSVLGHLRRAKTFRELWAVGIIEGFKPVGRIPVRRDYGTAVAGGFNLIYGGKKVLTGYGSLGGGAATGALPAVAFGTYNVATGGARFQRGLRQLSRGAPTCRTKCTIAGNYERVFFGITPRRTQDAVDWLGGLP